jgi:hypothetical protein
MAKTPYDLATLLDVIAGPAAEGSGDSFISALNGSWGELSIATIDFKKWWPGEDYLKPVESATKQMVSGVFHVSLSCPGLFKLFPLCLFNPYPRRPGCSIFLLNITT